MPEATSRLPIALTSLEPHDHHLAGTIRRLTEAVVNSRDVQAETKLELLELVSAVAAEATRS